MGRITAAATASPPHRLDRDDLRRWVQTLYAGRDDLPARLRIAEGTGVHTRYLALPPERIVPRRSFAERSAEYLQAALPLAEEAARRALDRARIDGGAVDLIVTTSCTGILIPSLAAYLAPRLGLRSDVVRLPITELGCAAGAAALARAADHLAAHAGAVALVLAVELPSLTFQVQDGSMTNFVSSALFGDGAAAVVLGAPPLGPGPAIVASRSHLFPSSTHLMGFDMGEGGFHIVLAREVPTFLEGRVRPLVESLCAAHGVDMGELAFAAVHPGGRRILANLERELGLPRAMTRSAWEVLAGHGNMSSATVLFVLERLLGERPAPAPGSWGLLAAFGPGFAAELSLLRWVL
jgi:alkylresorcinol/alkylpyrone synthase